MIVDICEHFSLGKQPILITTAHSWILDVLSLGLLPVALDSPRTDNASLATSLPLLRASLLQLVYKGREVISSSDSCTIIWNNTF